MVSFLKRVYFFFFCIIFIIQIMNNITQIVNVIRNKDELWKNFSQ